MTTENKITWFALMLAMFGLSYWLIAQSNAKAMEEYMNLAQEKELLIQANEQLNKDKKEESDWWWVDEDAKAECIKSWEDHQKQRNQNNIKRDKDIAANSWKIEEIDKKMGLIQSSQAQKKNKLLNNSETSDLNISWYTMNDTVEETQDSWWFKKLLNWVDSIW